MKNIFATSGIQGNTKLLHHFFLAVPLSFLPITFNVYEFRRWFWHFLKIPISALKRHQNQRLNSFISKVMGQKLRKNSAVILCHPVEFILISVNKRKGIFREILKGEI